jgi:zinc transport system substrate-binding protein
MKSTPCLAILLLGMLLLGVRSVGAAEPPVRVSVSILPQAYFVERVAGSRAAVQVMIPKGASPETYAPTPQQMVALSDSRIYIKVGSPGFPFEGKILGFRESMPSTVVSMSDGMIYRGEDPHIWTSPAAVRLAAQNIARALSAKDPAGGAAYQRNLKAFLIDIDVLDREIRQSLAGKQGYAFLVYHPAWGYFSAEYGLIQLAVEEEGKPVSAAHVRQTIDLARAKGIRTILVQRGFDTKAALAIAREIGGEVLETDPLERDWLSGMRQFTSLLGKVLRR